MLGISKSITIYMFLILGKIYQVGYTTVCFKILRKDVYFEGTISISIKERKAKESSSVKTIFFSNSRDGNILYIFYPIVLL